MGNENGKLLGVAALPQTDHSVVLMPLFTQEKTAKGDEWVGVQRWPLKPDQLEVVSGRCKTEIGETLPEALIREAREERGIRNIDTTRMVPETLMVGQERNGVSVDFLVHLFLSRLTDEQISALQEHNQLEIVGEDYLPTFMKERGKHSFRPSVWALLGLACDNNFWRN